MLVLLVLRVLLDFQLSLQLSFPLDENELFPFLPSDIIDECPLTIIEGFEAVSTSIASIFPMATAVCMADFEWRL